MRLIIQPDDGVTPLLAAIKAARKTVEIAVFRFDRKDIEAALKAAAARGVKVTALIAYGNGGGTKNLRKLEMRCLDAGIMVTRTAGDLARYHDKFVLIDRRTLYVLSFNFTQLDIGHSRGFGVVTTDTKSVREAVKLFQADCTRSVYAPGQDTFVVSPANARKTLGTLLKRAKKQLLIYDPRISDKEMLAILHDRAKAGVDIRIIGKVTGRTFNAQKLARRRLHTRTIISDGRQAFVGSQSLRTAELDSRRELGLVIRNPTIVKRLIETFESDWVPPDDGSKAPVPVSARVTQRQAEKAIQVLQKELDPLVSTVKQRVRKAVSKVGVEILDDKDVKNTVKRVVKEVVKEAVKDGMRNA